MKLFLISFILSTPLFAGPRDNVAAISPGKTAYIYMDEGNVIVRDCEDYKVIKKLSDCKNTVERNIGTPSEIGKKYRELKLSEKGLSSKVLDRLKELSLKALRSIDTDEYTELRKEYARAHGAARDHIWFAEKADRESQKYLNEIISSGLSVNNIKESPFLEFVCGSLNISERKVEPTKDLATLKDREREDGKEINSSSSNEKSPASSSSTER